MSLSSDSRFMALALSLGRRGMGNTWPNPAVGCVIVANNRIVGRGWTQKGGRPHAEVMALAQAGEKARGADAFVTLEPCAHHGKTGPCAEALVKAGVSRVCIAISDSDPRVNGLGIKILQNAGIEVQTGLLGDQAFEDHDGFLRRVVMGRPMVTLKVASSFDGRIATQTGESQWITSGAARRMVHAMRARHDAVMIGGGTARHDDPSLTVRGLGIEHHSTRVVISRHLDLPLMGQLAQSARDLPLIICHGPDADPHLVKTWGEIGATLIKCNTRGAHLDMENVLGLLGKHGLTRVFCEGGGALAASLISQDLVDQLIGFTAGVMLGAEGKANIGNLDVQKLAQAPRFKLKKTQIVGPDLLHIWTRQ